jgi:pimeloyl-ACP methyl ester carboxylesterase
MAPSKSNGRSQTFPFSTQFADIQGGPVAYFDAGTGEALIFVHGLVGDFTHFEHVAPAFAEGFRVAGLDLPGCGISCKPGSRHSIQGYARTLLDWMTYVGIERATLVGHSAGGLVAAQAALIAPRRVSRLVLMSSAGLRRYGPVTQWLARGLLRPRLLAATLERLAMPMLDHVFATRNAYTEKFVADSLDRPIHPTLPEMAKVFSDLTPDLLSPLVLDRAWSFTMPVLVLWGDADRLIPAESATEVASKMPSAKLVMVPECGHMPIIEKPGAVIEALRRFVGAGRAWKLAA